MGRQPCHLPVVTPAPPYVPTHLQHPLLSLPSSAVMFSLPSSGKEIIFPKGQNYLASLCIHKNNYYLLGKITKM